MQNQVSHSKQSQFKQSNIENDLPRSHQAQIVNIHSQFQDQYIQTMASYQVSVEQRRSLQLRLLKDQNINFDERYFQPRFNAELFDYTSNFQALWFRVTFGFFKMEISVLNVESLSQSHNFYYLHQNSVGSVFLYKDMEGKKYSIKCVHLLSNASAQIIRSLIKEVCILKIAHILGVGPKTTDLFGFDIIVYNNCAEFAMEYCKKSQNITGFDKSEIQKKIALMHKFNIVHLDIKPSNVMFSPSLKQIVFIDFGLSKHIKQKVGFKSRVKFSGSLSYCSKQMRKAYQTQLFQSIDLYFNDIVCLRKTIDELLQDQQSIVINQTQNYKQNELQMVVILHYEKYYKKASLFFTFSRVKYFIFKQVQFQAGLINSKDFICSYYYRLTEFVKLFKIFPNLRYNRYIKSLCADIQNQNNLRYTNFNFRFLKQIMNINEESDIQQNQQETNFIKVTNSLLNHCAAQINHEFSFCKKGKNQYVWLLNQQNVKQFKNNDFLIKCYANFVDFTINLSTFTQKVQSTKIIMEKLGIQYNNQQDQTYLLQKCQKSLLIQLVNTKKPYYEQVIPIFLRNLLILGSITCLQVVQLIKIVLGQSIDNELKFKLFIRIKLIFLLLSHQNFQYYNQDSLNQILREIFRIKIEEPFNSVMTKLSSTFFAQMFENYNKIKQVVATNTQNLYFQQKFIEQLIIWQFSSIYLGDKLETNHIELFYWPRLEFIEIYLKKYNIMFDFYQFPLMYFPNEIVGQKMRKKIYSNMSKCLGRQTIFKKFLIYYSYNNKKMRNEKIQKQITYYSQLSKQLIQRYEQLDQQKSQWLIIIFLLDRRENQILSQLLLFYKKNQYLKQAQAILLSLKKLITFDILKQIINYSNFFKDDQQNVLYKNSLGSLLFTLVCLIYLNIYKNEPGLSKQLHCFCQQIGEQILKRRFYERLMQIHFDYSLLTIKVRALELQNKNEKIVQTYQEFITKYLSSEPETFINSDFFNRPFLVYISKSYSLQPQTKGKQALKFYFQTVIKYNRFKSLFSLSTFQQSCRYLTIYALAFLDLQSFLEMHVSFCRFFLLYPYDNYVIDYIQSFQMLKQIQQKDRIQSCWLYLEKEAKTYLTIKNKYIAILYVFLLTENNQNQKEVKKWSKFSTKVLAFIVKRISNINLSARYFVLGNVYSYLYMVDSEKTFYNRKYLNFRLKKISYTQLKKATKLKGKKKEIKILQVKLKRWFQILNN